MGRLIIGPLHQPPGRLQNDELFAALDVIKGNTWL